MAALLVVVPHFVEVIFVQLAYKACEIAMLEVFRQDGFGESLVLRSVSGAALEARLLRMKSHLEHNKASAIVPPTHDLRV